MLEDLKNIGPTTAAWLRDAGIKTREQLEDLGPVMAYKMVKHRHPGMNLLGLYALQGALLDVHWNALPPDLKERLKRDAQETLTVFPAT